MPHAEELPDGHGDIRLTNGDVRDLYEDWESPVAIVSDGAYGVDSFPGDPRDTDDLVDWYESHVAAWTEKATPQTTLWFWNTELGWATVHPLLEEYGWEYRGANIWNKGIQHIAGNTNTQTLRRFPPVTEVCVQYTRPSTVSKTGETVREWLRSEWKRAGLTFDEANDACGVKDAASRKYFGKDEQWYFPPAEMFEQLVEYANEHGDPDGEPYFALEDEKIPTGDDWEKLRAKFDCPVGVTNVWEHPQVRGEDRIELPDGTPHPNQKPLELMERVIRASTDPGDVVWEPFGGLCTAAIASKRLGRQCRSAEVIDEYYEASVDRLTESEHGTSGGPQQPGLDSFGDS